MYNVQTLYSTLFNLYKYYSAALNKKNSKYVADLNLYPNTITTYESIYIAYSDEIIWNKKVIFYLLLLESIKSRTLSDIQTKIAPQVRCLSETAIIVGWHTTSF